MEKLRLAVFSMLDNLGGISEKRVLDLFAGSGAFGFEALSRGAAHCTFVESDRALARFILDTAQKLDLQSTLTVLQGELPKALAQVQGSYDLVFSDPPYAAYDPDLGLQLVERGILAPEALFISESPERSAGLADLSLELVRDKRHGDSRVRIYRHS